MDTRNTPRDNGAEPKIAPEQAVAKQPPAPAQSPYAGKPLDGSQYVDVIEEQEYADQRPTPEEQKPRYSYLHAPPPRRRLKK